MNAFTAFPGILGPVTALVLVVLGCRARAQACALAWRHLRRRRQPSPDAQHILAAAEAEDAAISTARAILRDQP